MFTLGFVDFSMLARNIGPTIYRLLSRHKRCDLYTDFSTRKQSHIFATMKKTRNRSRQCQPKKKYITSKKSDLDLIILNHIVMELERDKANNNGKLPYAAISTIVARMKPTAPFLTKAMVKYHLWKLNKTEKQLLEGAADAQLDLLYPSNTTMTANASNSPHVDASTISTLTNDHEDNMEGIREESSATIGNNAPVSDSRSTAIALNTINPAGTHTCEDVVAGVATQHVNDDDTSHRSIRSPKGQHPSSFQRIERTVEACSCVGCFGIRHS